MQFRKAAAALHGKLPYQRLRDFTPIARTAMQPPALLVNPQVPVNSLEDLLACGAVQQPGARLD